MELGGATLGGRALREFKTIGAFLTFMRGVENRLPAAGTAGLTAAAVMIETAAKAELGRYQHGAGPFDDWMELAAATKADRLRQGYAENDPGFRSGEMQASIGHTVEGREAAIGSDDEYLVYFELGTAKQPPRSVLGLAGVRQTDAAVDAMSGPVAELLAGTPLIRTTPR